MPDPKATNHRSKVWKVKDQAGVVTSEEYDFKGNLLRSNRQLTEEYKREVDWSGSPTLETTDTGAEKVYRSKTTYDALNRPVRLVTPHCEGMRPNVVQPGYNEANLLETIYVWLRREEVIPDELLEPNTADFRAVKNINYNAKGQRELIEYGNGVKTAYTYDPQTFRLVHLFTTRGTTFPEDCDNPTPCGDPPQDCPQRRLFPCGVQNLQYTYDPVGNITTIHDNAQQTIFFRNQRVKPCAEYTYDSLYRLIAATGREHLGQHPDGTRAPIPIGHDDSLRMNRPHPGNDQAMGRYIQRYVYDEVGNILEMIHHGTDPDHPGWRRCYQYALDSNRLLSTGYQSDPLVSCEIPYAADSVYRQVYNYDLHGNMTQMPHLSSMQWDFKDQLQASSKQAIDRGTPETTYYVYDASGQRVRKVTERQNGTRWKERIYLGGFELYREYNGDGTELKKKRESLHVMDGQQRIALVETKTYEIIDGIGGEIDSPSPLIRYQLNNHLSSACVELDREGNLISYEEFYPYGSTAYQAGRSAAEVSLKRYRYLGKERDDETGLNHFGARYYASWLGRWCSADPIGINSGLNLFSYSWNNPIRYQDKQGKNPGGPGSLSDEELLSAPPSTLSPDELRRRRELLRESEVSSSEQAETVAMPAKLTEVRRNPWYVNAINEVAERYIIRPVMGLIGNRVCGSTPSTVADECRQQSPAETLMRTTVTVIEISRWRGSMAENELGHGLSETGNPFSNLGMQFGPEGESDLPEVSIPETGSDVISQTLTTTEQSLTTTEIGEFTDEAIVAVEEENLTPGQPLQLTPHRYAGRNRTELGLPGRGENAYESVHVSPQAALRDLENYNPNNMLNRLLPREHHRGFEAHWKNLFQHSSGTHITAQELYETVADAIQSYSHFSDEEKFSMTSHLYDELFCQMGLKPNDLVRRPYSRRN